MHMMLPICPSAENSSFLLVEATVCCWFCYGKASRRQTNKNHLCGVPTLVWSSDQVLWWMAVTATFQRIMHCQLICKILSCGNNSKTDWCFQHSGSGSNSLNSKLPGYSLGSRLDNNYISVLNSNWQLTASLDCHDIVSDFTAEIGDILDQLGDE